MLTAAIVVLALILDGWLGEPRRGHPVVGFGRIAERLERRLNRQTDAPRRRQLAGAGAALLLVAGGGTAAFALVRLPAIGVFFQVILLFLCLGHSSLVEHARRVARPLEAGNLGSARRRLGFMVSRDTQGLEEHQIAAATSESVLENGSDAVFATLFWFVVAGAPGAVIHRLANTLDAMWGYRSARYLDFGRAAARLDDLLGWLPARLTAVSYALTGDLRRSLTCWRLQAHSWDSPNAGPVMAAGAGALGIELGGPAPYHGALRERPRLGTGRTPRAFDIERALSLLKRSLWAWVIVIVMGGLLLA